MVEIHLDDKFVITSDNYGFVLNKKGKKTKGRGKKTKGYTSHSFHSTMEDLLREYINTVGKDSDSKTLKEYIDVINKAKDDVEKKMEEATKKEEGKYVK